MLNIQPLFVIIVTSFLALTGCENNSAEDSLKTYNERLANVLDVSPSQVPDTDIPQLANIRELALPIEDIRIGLLDAYELRKCGLFQLIAERNSVLGKVQDKTHRFRYELLFMDGLENCLETLPKDADILPDIKQLHQLKQQQLPIYLWNMLTTGEEWRKQFRIYRRVFTLENFPGFVENQEAMRYLLAIHTALMNGETVPPKPSRTFTGLSTTNPYPPLFWTTRLLYCTISRLAKSLHSPLGIQRITHHMRHQS